MKRKNSTLQALFTSIMSLLLCVSMLVGTTFAWFTDTVTSGVNTIAAGNLDVELYHSKTTDFSDKNKVDGQTTLFTDKDGKKIENWEPGVVAYSNFQVANVGSLALKYQMSVNFSGMNYVEVEGKQYSLADALQVAVVEGGFTGDRADAQALNLVPMSSFVLSGELEGETTSKTYGIVIYWEPTDNDNIFNLNNGKTTTEGDKILSIDLGINLFATQEMYENDSFDETYDEGAVFEATANADGSAILTVPVAPSVADNATTVEAPAGAFEEGASVEIDVDVENTLFNVNSDGAVVATVDVTMTVNGEETSGDLTDSYYTVTTYIATGLSDVTVVYTGTDDKDQPINVTYNAETGELSFQTNHFSEYAVSGKAYGYDAEKDQAYADKAEAAQAAVNGDIEIPVEDLKAVCNALSTSAEKNEFKKNNGIAKYGSNVYYLTVDEFVKAFEQESDYTQKIKILRDFNVGNEKIIITNGQKWEIDLNGCTLSSSNTNIATHNFMIDVKGGTLTAKNGTIQQQHTGTNMGWSGATTVIDVTAGGVLNLEGVTVENLGGTDMTFAVHLNNWGEVTMNADNCVFKAPYCSVRVFNSGGDMNNVKITNSTLTGNKMAFWVHNYDSSDLSTWYYSDGTKGAYDQAKVDARLNLDIYGNNNSFVVASDAYPSPIRYGFNKGIYFNADGAQIVSDASQLAAAVAAGGTIILNNNIEVSEILAVTGDATLDLNGYTLTNNNIAPIKINGGTLTLKDSGENGAVVAGSTSENNDDKAAILFGTNGGKFVMESGALKATKYGVRSNKIPTSEIVINGGTIEAEYYGVYDNSGSVTMNGGTIIANTANVSYGIAAYGNFIMNGGKITAACAYCSQGTYDDTVAVINGGELIATVYNGIYWPSAGSLTINGGTITGPNAVHVRSGSLSITGGKLTGTGEDETALTVENIGGDSGYQAITSVSVTGGTFISENGLAVTSIPDTTGSNTDAVAVTGFIKGGTYSSDPDAYVADGYTATESNGVWTVAAN